MRTATRNLLDALPEVSARIARARSVFLGLDFDGTLAPIQPHPDEVALSDSIRETLRLLGSLPDVHAMIVSGRALSDVRRRVALPGWIYAGNHGLEIQGPGLAFVEPTAAACAEDLIGLASRLAESLRDIPGALVEPKGPTMSVHDRNVVAELRPQVEAVVRAAVVSVADRFVVTAGHRVWEIRPRVPWHKGAALLWAINHAGGPPPRLAIYIGDDRTDEDAFVSLPDGVTARVGPASSTRARFTLDDPASVERFLRWLHATLVERRPH